MPIRNLNIDTLGPKVDWAGNNIALECPVCRKVYLVSGFIHKERACPDCGRSRGAVNGTSKDGGTAWISWEE
jgi:uncharacterized protein (DUF983 family)